MTVSTILTASVAADALANARRLVLPTLPGLLLFAAAMGAQTWFNQIAGQGGNSLLLWLAVSFVTVFVGCFWSADMYRKLLPESGGGPVIGDAARLFLANLAVYGLYFILGFLLTLFFSILAGILIGEAGYDPSEVGTTGETVQRSIEALSGSGGAVVLYLLLLVALAGLIWVGLRLILFGAATVSERRITIFRSWAWTSGHVARLALLWLLLQALPWIVLSLLASGVLHLAGLQTVYSMMTGAGEAAPGLPVWQTSAVNAGATLIMAPFYWLGHGLAVALYQRLSPVRVDADTTFG